MSGEWFWVEFCFERIVFVHLVFDIGKKNLSFVGKFPSVLSEIPFTNWEKVIEQVLLWKSFLSKVFWILGETCSDFCFSDMIVKSAWCVSGIGFWGRSFCLKQLALLISFRILGETFSDFGQTIFKRFAETAFYVPSKIISTNGFFWEELLE